MIDRSSPGGTRLAVFVTTPSRRTARPALVGVGTGTVRIARAPRLTLGQDVAWARWLPGGTHLILGAGTGASYLMDAATLSARPLTVTGGRTGGEVNDTAAIIPPPAYAR
jgi:hypothetical protein